MIIGGKNFDLAHNTYIMGILNVTPDSFSDGGRYDSLDRALFHAEEMVRQGADIIDVGGESTRPNHVKISVQEEIDRVAPVLEKLRGNFDVPLSLDSYKSAVIAANLTHIDLINDIWGLKYDSNMAKVIADSDLPCCLMHNRPAHDYTLFWDDFMLDMQQTLQLAKSAGIAQDKIILDGGVGFQKNTEENLMVMNRTEILRSLGCPVMLAVSRKSIIGSVLNKEVNDRLYGTLATTVLGVMKGASFMRVHDISENKDVIQMTKAILEEKIWTTFK